LFLKLREQKPYRTNEKVMGKSSFPDRPTKKKLKTPPEGKKEIYGPWGPFEPTSKKGLEPGTVVLEDLEGYHGGNDYSASNLIGGLQTVKGSAFEAAPAGLEWAVTKRESGSAEITGPPGSWQTWQQSFSVGKKNHERESKTTVSRKKKRRKRSAVFRGKTKVRKGSSRKENLQK